MENYKKVAPGKKEQIFSKTVSVAASVLYYNYYFLNKIYTLIFKHGATEFHFHQYVS